MRAILVDDDPLCLEMEAAVLEDVEIIEDLKTFSDIDPVIKYISENEIDVAFLDIVMDQADGISLAMTIQQIQPKCNIIFVSGSRDYALEAFGVYASGYLLKPLTVEDVENTLAHILI